MNYTDFSIQSDDSEQVKDLKRQIINLQAQLEIERANSQKLKGGNLLNSAPIDLYDGEQLDFILSILEQVKDKCSPDSRPYDIISSILSLNEPVGKGKEILDKLKKIFRGGDKFTESDIAALREIGFTYVTSKRHPKLKFKDKYLFVIASTLSDKQHGEKNNLSQISKCIASSLKI